MMPQFDALGETLKFLGAISTLFGAMAQWKKSSSQEDEIVVESCNVIIDTLTNADSVNKIDLATGRNLRDQLTIEQVQDMDYERRLRGFKNRN